METDDQKDLKPGLETGGVAVCKLILVPCGNRLFCVLNNQKILTSNAFIQLKKIF